MQNLKTLTLVLSILAPIAILVFSAQAFAKSPEKRIIVGYVENIKIEDIDGKVKAKLDTGAETTSVHADIIEQTDDDVIFEISTDAKSIEGKNIKKKIERFVKIKKKNGEGFIRRPVIKMTFCIAGQRVEEEVNLSERDGFIYDVLIGRNMLEEGLFIVDVSKTFTGKPNCPKLAE